MRLYTRSLSQTARFLSTSSAGSPSPPELVGTVPFHTSYILLHTRHPPSTYPNKVPSQLQRTLQRSVSQWGGLVNFSWSPHQPLSPRQSHASGEWEVPEEEAYYATVFSARRARLEIPEISMDNLRDVEQRLKEHLSSPAPQSERPQKAVTTGVADNVLHLFVCTHGQRDCRCGETGGQVLAALQKEVKNRGMSERVKVGSVGHVGGHKYAANLLVYPSGDWLGNLTAENVPRVLDTILSEYSTASPSFTSSPHREHWRGRMGLDKEEQLALFSFSSEPRPSEGPTTAELKPLLR